MNMWRSTQHLVAILCILSHVVQNRIVDAISVPTTLQVAAPAADINDVDVPPMGTCRQECAGHSTGCPAGQVCCRTGCGHICQSQRCPRIKLTPYPFCLTHCPLHDSEHKPFCLCYNACMNVRCGRDEVCVPKHAKCENGSARGCLPLGVCVNVNKHVVEQRTIFYVIRGKTVPWTSGSAAATGLATN